MPQPEPAQANYSVCTHPRLGTDTGCLWKKDSKLALFTKLSLIWSDFDWFNQIFFLCNVHFEICSQMENALQILSWWGLHSIRTTTPALLQHWKRQSARSCTSQLLFKQREAFSVSLKALSSDLLTLISQENESNEGNSKGAGPIPMWPW